MREVRKRRHWLRGIVGGLLFGLGIGIMSIVLAFNAFGPLTPWLLLLAGIVLGIVLVFVPSPWRRPQPPPERTITTETVARG
jgi:hypothetical protein